MDATVMVSEADAFAMTTEQACDEFGVVDRALRKWHRQGMPFTVAPDGTNRYGNDARTWYIRREILKRTNRWRDGATYLPLSRLWRMEIEEQENERPSPVRAVLVPLDWDHPLRERLLREACLGWDPSGTGGVDRDDLDGDEVADD